MIKNLTKICCTLFLTITLAACLPGEDKIFDVKDNALKNLMVERLSNSFSDTIEEDIANYIVEVNTNIQNQTFANRKVQTIQCGDSQMISYIPISALDSSDIELLKTDASAKLLESLQNRFGNQTVGYFNGEEVVAPSGVNITAQGNFLGEQGCVAASDGIFEITDGTVTSEIIPKGAPVIFMSLRDIKNSDALTPADGSIDPRSMDVSKTIYDCSDTATVTPPSGQVGVGKVVYTQYTEYTLDEDGKRTDTIESVTCRLGATNYSGTEHCNSTAISAQLENSACTFVDEVDQPDDIQGSLEVSVGFDWSNYFSTGLSGGRVGRVTVGCFMNNTTGENTCTDLENMSDSSFGDETGLEVMGYYIRCLETPETEAERKFITNPTGVNPSDVTELVSDNAPQADCGKLVGVDGTGWQGDVKYQYRVRQCNVEKVFQDENGNTDTVSCSSADVDCGDVSDSYFNIYQIAPIAMKCSNTQLGIAEPQDCESPYMIGEHYVAKSFEMDHWVLLDPWHEQSVRSRRIENNQYGGSVIFAGAGENEYSQELQDAIEHGLTEGSYKFISDSAETDPTNEEELNALLTTYDETYKVGEFGDITGCYTDSMSCSQTSSGISNVGILVDSSKSMNIKNGQDVTFSMRICEKSVKSMFNEDPIHDVCELLDQNIQAGLYREPELTEAQKDSLRANLKPDYYNDIDYVDVILDNDMDCSTVTQDFVGHCAASGDDCQNTCPGGKCTSYEETLPNPEVYYAAELAFKNHIIHSLFRDYNYLIYKDMFASDNYVKSSPDHDTFSNFDFGQVKADFIYDLGAESNSACYASGNRSDIIGELQALIQEAENDDETLSHVYIFSDAQSTALLLNNGEPTPTSICGMIKGVAESHGLDITLVVPDNSDMCLERDVNNNISSRQSLDNHQNDGDDVITLSESQQISNAFYLSNDVAGSSSEREQVCQEMYGQNVSLITQGSPGGLNGGNGGGECELGEYQGDNPEFVYSSSHDPVQTVDLPCALDGQHCSIGRSCTADSECGIGGACNGYTAPSYEYFCDTVNPYYDGWCAGSVNQTMCESHCYIDNGTAEGGGYFDCGSAEYEGEDVKSACSWSGVAVPAVPGSCSCYNPADDKPEEEEEDNLTLWQCGPYSSSWNSVQEESCTEESDDCDDPDAEYNNLSGSTLCCSHSPNASCVCENQPANNIICYH